MTTKTKKNTENLTAEKVYNQAKETVTKVNDFVLDTSADAIDNMIERGEQWQGVADKAIKGGFKLASKNQDLMFSTLESLKSQFVTGRKRFSKLVNTK